MTSPNIIKINVKTLNRKVKNRIEGILYKRLLKSIY